MSVTKVKTGWQVRFNVNGRLSTRIQKTFKRKFDAEQYEISEKAKGQLSSYAPPVKDDRRLSELIEDWHNLYGSALKDGQKRYSKLLGLAERLGNPMASKFSPEDWLKYRNKRITETRRNSNHKQISKNNLNHEHTYLCAVYNQLIKLKNWQLKNPMSGIPKFILDEPELSFLELTEIDSLLDACLNSSSKELYLRVKLCLHTGARWGEPGTVTGAQIRAGKIVYSKTKNGLARAVPLAPGLEKELFDGRPRNGLLFRTDPKKAFYTAIKKAGIVLPAGQATHILRHSFASHYMIADGNIMKLQKLLGHKDIKQTLRYAHLSPSHLIESLEKNPLAQLTSSHRVATM